MHLILIGIVVVMFIVIAFLIGRQSKTQKQSDSPPHQKPYEKLKENLVKLEVKPKSSVPQKTDPNNPKYVDKIKEILKDMGNKYCEFAADYISVGYGEQYSGLVEKYGNDDDSEESDHEFSIEEIGEIIHWFKPTKIKCDFEDHIEEMATGFVDAYIEIVDNLTEIYEDESLERFKPTKDQSENEINKITGSLKRNLNKFYLGLNDLQILQNKLANIYPRIADISKDKGWDLSYLARSFGAGAITALNPFIGVPAFIANFSMKSKKVKNENEFVENFFQEYQKYIDQVNELAELYRNEINNKHQDFLNSTWNSLIIGSTGNILKYLNEKGYSLKNSHKSFIKDLSDLNKNLKE